MTHNWERNFHISHSKECAHLQSIIIQTIDLLVHCSACIPGELLASRITRLPQVRLTSSDLCLVPSSILSPMVLSAFLEACQNHTPTTRQDPPLGHLPARSPWETPFNSEHGTPFSGPHIRLHSQKPAAVGTTSGLKADLRTQSTKAQAICYLQSLAILLQQSPDYPNTAET